MRANRGRFETFSDCERKYFYTFNSFPGAPLGLTKVRQAPALRIGSAAHKFLETWYDNLEMPTEERLQLAHLSLQESLAETKAPFSLPGEQQNESDIEGETTRLMSEYVKRYGSREDFAVLQPEVEGEVPLGKHLFKFRTDALVSYDDRLWLLEHKTTYELGQRFLDKFILNHQMTSYTWAAGKKVGKLISGIMLNALRKEIKRAQIPTPAFHRETFVITEDHITAMLDSFHYKFSDIESRDPTNVREWPQDTNRCHDYGQCPFWEICAHGSPAEVGTIYKPRAADYVDIANQEEKQNANAGV